MRKTPDRPPIEQDDIDILLIEMAERILVEHFFDPDNEDAYRRQLSTCRLRQAESIILDDATVDIANAPCTIRLEALRTWTMFRVALSHRDFNATIEGSWSFDNQEMLRPAVLGRTGTRDTLHSAIEQIDAFCFGQNAGDGGGIDNASGPDDDDHAPALIGNDP